MKYTRLGRTDLTVSEICLGTMTWGEQNTEAEAHAQMDYALERGVTFFDTAELYATPARAETQGLTERYIASWFKARGTRDKVILASKITGPGNAWIRGGRPITAAEIPRALDASLARLETDHIDLYQLHWPNRAHYGFERSWTFSPYGQDRAEIIDTMHAVLEALDAAVKAGKIRAVGLSNETSWGTMQFLALAERHGLPRMATIQNEYSLLRRQHDLDLAEVSWAEDVGLLAYSPLGTGLLTGKYRDGAVPEGSRKQLGGFWRDSPQSQAASDAYVDLARTHGLDPAQMALAFCLTRPFIPSTIIGATSLDQLETNIGAADITLSPELLEGIEAIHRRYPRPV